MEHLSNALKAVFKEQDGDEVLFCADMLQKDGKYNHSELPRPDTEMNESQIQFLLRKVNTYNTLDQESMVGQVVISEWMEPLKAHKELKSFDQSVLICYCILLVRQSIIKIMTPYAVILNY